MAAISAADANVILVILFLHMRQKPSVRLNVDESGEPWETFHHALSTKREHLRSHMVMASARLREDASAAGRRNNPNQMWRSLSPVVFSVSIAVTSIPKCLAQKHQVNLAVVQHLRRGLSNG
jgi:hypothetical protein